MNQMLAPLKIGLAHEFIFIQRRVFESLVVLQQSSAHIGESGGTHHRTYKRSHKPAANCYRVGGEVNWEPTQITG